MPRRSNIYLKNKRWEWIGHIARLFQGRSVKQTFESKLVGSRKRDKTVIDVRKMWRRINGR
jgi:hypothetical protein